MNRVPVLIYIFKTFKALIHGDEPEIRRAFQEPYPEETAFPGYKAQILTNFASYSLGARDVPAASEAVKESILTYQKYRGLRGLARSYRLFSLVNLYRQNLSDAIDYFAFAVENAEKHDDPGELAVINYYAAGAYFLFGNLSKAEWFAAAAEQTAMDAGRPEWADRAGFLRGRCRFESGRYKEALKIFEVLRKNPAKSLSPEAEQVLAAWIYRTNVFLRTPAVRPPGEMNGDALFFEVEASYLAEDYQKTANLAGRLPGKLSGERFLFIEQPDWHSGFAQCELLLFPQRVFWDRMVSTYHALALSRLGHVHGAEREQAARVMERIMRNERLPDTDPNDSFYCYSYYRVLRDYGAAEVDINTAVSMAFKRLQRRAGRIDDPETKRAYLSLPYWNGALSLAARDHKLI
jgi:tetratricopeptide (TPR) repeat protein